MPLLRYSPARIVPYNGAGPAWAPGEVREVAEPEASRLLAMADTVGPWFALEGAATVAPVADELPPVEIAARNGVAKKWKKKG